MTTRARGCWPSGDSASRRIESGALTRSTPVKPLRSRPSWTTTSARVRRSVNSCQRTSRSSSARRASSGTGWRAGAVAHPPASTSRPRRLLRRLRATLGPTPAILEVVDLLLDPFGGRVELERLVEVLPALGVHVTDVVVRLGVLGVERDHLPKRPNGVVELRLLLEDDAELKVEVLVLVIEAEALLEGLRGALVLFRAKVRGAEVEEELGSLRLEVDGVAENRDRLVVVFGPPVQKPELDAGVDRARV